MIILLSILLGISVIANIILAVLLCRQGRSLRDSNWQLSWYGRLMK